MNFCNKWDFRVEPTIEQLDVEAVKSRLKVRNSKLLDMVRLAQMESGCRMREIYQYFGHASAGACGLCDLCVKGKGEWV